MTSSSFDLLDEVVRRAITTKDAAVIPGELFGRIQKHLTGSDDRDAGHIPISHAYIVERAGGRWTDIGRSEMFDIWISAPDSASDPTPATVVPTRLHAPGFYVRSPGKTAVFAAWYMRDPEDLAMFERFCNLKWVSLRV